MAERMVFSPINKLYINDSEGATFVELWASSESKELIQRAEEQIKKGQNSIAILARLEEYYRKTIQEKE